LKKNGGGLRRVLQIKKCFKDGAWYIRNRTERLQSVWYKGTTFGVGGSDLVKGCITKESPFDSRKEQMFSFIHTLRLNWNEPFLDTL